jgi:hypothetical protein
VKDKRAKPCRPVAPAVRNKKPARPNDQVNRQNRKVLGQHYRAKYGVK